MKLPPLLVRLYTEVADGGFGPGDGTTPIAQLPALREEYTVDLVEAEDLDPEAEGGLRDALSPMAPSITEWIVQWLRSTA